MTQHFEAYVSNLNRVRLIELIDREAALMRHARARPSLIVNPLSGRPYLADEGLAQEARPLSPDRR
ncbi:MAG TPA: hypothetical protein VN623_12160 [Hyphomicrobium sp.]|jgi:hypothetical protein|nr:hypothetical protein [Hyphomicrobium sp.]